MRDFKGVCFKYRDIYDDKRQTAPFNKHMTSTKSNIHKADVINTKLSIFLSNSPLLDIYLILPPLALTSSPPAFPTKDIPLPRASPQTNLSRLPHRRHTGFSTVLLQPFWWFPSAFSAVPSAVGEAPLSPSGGDPPPTLWHSHKYSFGIPRSIPSVFTKCQETSRDSLGFGN